MCFRPSRDRKKAIFALPEGCNNYAPALPSFSFSLAAAVESLHFEFILETSERASQTSERGALGIFEVVICLSPRVVGDCKHRLFYAKT